MIDQSDGSKKLDHSGHRARLKDRFIKGGAKALADYELLELLLFSAIPRRDVKPLAKELLTYYGDFSAVLSATPEDLSKHPGIGESAVLSLKLVKEAAVRLAQVKVLEKPILSNWKALQDYLRVAMANETREQFRILFLNRKNILIADEIHGKGTVDHTPVYTREVVKRALDLAASALILVHNHPSGDPKASKGDIAMTREIREACSKLDIAVHDHLIVGKHGMTSFKSMGLL
ncbi:DNA repair protein RadC [Temperatibacter marinus]|uniref:DNA repair protein RadC n=1 Tax=Temperatibacter marinus TaxID=1456591 RepID=A0AA52HAA1_9PROT|nr:DNA repair protein RadC [Temperatibacter marinus]WND02525.1 DNA repair protein RadC [Temperatibacter marinus]